MNKEKFCLNLRQSLIKAGFQDRDYLDYLKDQTAQQVLQ